MYEGVEHVGGDMFDSVPKGDAIILKVSVSKFVILLLSYINIYLYINLIFKNYNCSRSLYIEVIKGYVMISYDSSFIGKNNCNSSFFGFVGLKVKNKREKFILFCYDGKTEGKIHSFTIFFDEFFYEYLFYY